MTLCEKMRRTSIGRNKAVAKLDRAKWAIIDKENLEKKVEQIGNLVAGLEGLYAPSKDAQVRLAAEEVKKLGQETTQQILQQLAQRNECVDKELKDALESR